VRETNAKLGPFLGETKPPTLEPAAKEYHELRQKQCTEFPISASFERSDERLSELAAGAQFAQPGSTGRARPPRRAQDKIRLDIADKLTSIAVELDSAMRGGLQGWLSSWASALSMILAKASISSGLKGSKTRRRTALT
jgi:hypothetical protein